MFIMAIGTQRFESILKVKKIVPVLATGSYTGIDGLSNVLWEQGAKKLWIVWHADID